MSTILVASGGGHLQQMHALLPRLGLSDEIVWATPDSGLAQHLLKGQTHIRLPYFAPRNWRGALLMTELARKTLKDLKVERVISTGASPAPPFFLAGALLGLDLHYIESATRSIGPSLSGKLVSMLPAANLYTQYPSWAGKRWSYRGSIFDPYAVAEGRTGSLHPRRFVVTFGTEEFQFRRAAERIHALLPRGAEVLWQTGPTTVSDLGIVSRSSVPGDELRQAIADADVVISHSGTGSAITAFDLGKRPILIPREARFGEHIDDHQSLTARELGRRGLAVCPSVEELTPKHFHLAMSTRIIRDQVVRPFRLAGSEKEVPGKAVGVSSEHETVMPTAGRHRATGVVDLRRVLDLRDVLDLRGGSAPPGAKQAQGAPTHPEGTSL